MKNTGKTIWMKVRNPTGWGGGGSQGVEGTRNQTIPLTLTLPDDSGPFRCSGFFIGSGPRLGDFSGKK